MSSLIPSGLHAQTSTHREAQKCEKLIKKWANYYCDSHGDDQTIAQCDYWCQILSDHPDLLPGLMHNLQFVKILREAEDYARTQPSATKRS